MKYACFLVDLQENGKRGVEKNEDEKSKNEIFSGGQEMTSFEIFLKEKRYVGFGDFFEITYSDLQVGFLGTIVLHQ